MKSFPEESSKTEEHCCCSIANSRPTLCDPMDCSTPGSSVHRITQARILEWVAISFSRGSSWRGTGSTFPALAGQFFTTAPLGKPLISYTPTVVVQSLSLFFFFFALIDFIFKLYIIVLVLPNIKMNPPQVYMCSPF